jgi:hypothetical protein
MQVNMSRQGVDVFQIMAAFKLQKVVLSLQIFRVTFLVRCFTRLLSDIIFCFTKYYYYVDDFKEAVTKACFQSRQIYSSTSSYLRTDKSVS